MFLASLTSLGLLGLVAARGSFVGKANTEIWLEEGRSAIVKVWTQEYPLWVEDTSIRSSQDTEFIKTDNYSGVLLNITLGHDNKTLFLNNQQVFPFANSNIPPRIDAWQVPITIPDAEIMVLASAGVFQPIPWPGLIHRKLHLDYDRLITSDPESTTWYAHEPILQFQILGIGVPGMEDFKLDPFLQRVVEVKMKDVSYTSSKDPGRNYQIIDIVESFPEQTRRKTPKEQGECTLWSWRCPDQGLYEEGVAPWYRFIWRERFDEYGRVGSLRHAVYKKLCILGRNLEEAGPWMLISFGILMVSFFVIRAVVVSVRSYRELKALQIRNLAADDRLLCEDGEEGFEKYVDDDKEADAVSAPSEQVKKHGVLVDVKTGGDW